MASVANSNGALTSAVHSLNIELQLLAASVVAEISGALTKDVQL